jgi:hypothetical protein
MKIAILFSGRITADMQQYENVMGLINSNEADIFICYQKNSNPEVVKSLISLYRPKKITENDEIVFPVDKYQPFYGAVPYNVVCMQKARYIMKSLFQEYVEETKTEYDIVISTRMDNFYNTFPKWDELLPVIRDNHLCIPEGNDWGGGVNDQIAVGNYHTISLYLSIYDSLFHLLESGVIMHPETLLLHYLQSYDQNITRFPLSYFINRNLPDTKIIHNPLSGSPIDHGFITFQGTPGTRTEGVPGFRNMSKIIHRP